MTNRNRVRLSKLALGLAIALAAAPAFAQNTTSALDGRVSGASGAPVAGAQVTIVHAESGSSATVTTDADGRYAARGLRPGGPYTITVTKDGMSEKRENVYLQLAETAHVDARLGAAAADLGSVVVVGAGESPFSPTAMGTGTSISSEDLESFASIRRDLQDYARQDPRVALTTGRFGELQLSVAGQHNRYNSITIDGVATSDTFGLESNGLPTAKQPISIDAIEVAQVNVSNYDVTQTGYIGANVNAVTKSGTNEFHGSLSFTFRNDRLSGDQYDQTADRLIDPPAFKDTIKTVTFGGPILKDRLFFFAAWEELESIRAGVTTGPVGSGLPEVGITQAQIQTAIDLAARPCGAGVAPTCGMDIGVFAPKDGLLKVTDKLVKFDWNITENHRASLRWNKTEQYEDVFRNIGGTRTLSLSSHWDADIKEFENATAQVFSDWTDDLSTELRLTYRTVDSTHAINTEIPGIRIDFGGSDPAGNGVSTRNLFIGPESSRHFNELHTDTFDGFLAATWFKGDHEIKFGADFNRTDFYNSFQQNTRGFYVFDCLLSATCANSFEAGRPASYTATVPQAGRTLDDSAAIWGMKNLGVFAQDSWTVNDNLTVLFGLRADRISVGDEPLFQERASDGLSTSDAVVLNNTTPFARQSGGFGFDNTVTIDGSMLVQPRVGFNYTFDSKRDMQLRGGVGLFQGMAANVWLSNPFTNTGEAVQATGCGGALGSCGVFFSNDPDNPAVLVNSVPRLDVDIIDPDLDQPSVWKANLGFEREMIFDRLIFSADLIVTRVNEAIYYQNLNLGQPSMISPVDGRPLFYNAQGYNPACFRADGTVNTSVCPTSTAGVVTRARSNSAYRDVIIARPTDEGGAEALTLALSRENPSWSWSLAYTRTNSDDVSALTSSTSGSQWGKMPGFDPNDPQLSRSSYEIKNRYTGTINWHHEFFGDYETRVGLFYEGRSGKPYSWVFNNDLNGDASSRSNDLLYIPSAPGSGEVIFLGGPAAEARFWDFVNAHESLSKYAGSVVPRNSGTSPSVNQFDLRISQELPGFMKGHKARLNLDIMNVGNLLHEDWGRIYEPFDIEATRRFVNYVGMQDGKYIYSVPAAGPEKLFIRNFRGESSWAAQLSLKYEF
jgi:hypothetical protein